MEFNHPNGIYQQIADQVKERIAEGEWTDGDRIPSVREMAVTMGVNPNTVARSYQSLLGNGIIENRRGTGYFVARKAQEKVIEEMRKEIIGKQLPKMFRMMEKTDMDIEELVSLHEKFLKEKNR